MLMSLLKASPLAPYLSAMRIAAVVVAVAVVFGAGWTVNGWRWEAAVNEQKAAASQLLADRTAEVRALESARAADKARADAAALEKRKEIEDAHDRNVALGRSLDGALECLRVGGRWADGRCAVRAAGVSPGQCGELQARVEQLSGSVGRLAAAGVELARDADREAAVAADARAWAERTAALAAR
jgi:hypothetical protein